MTIDELHDYCRYLLDKNHVHGVPDKWSEGYEFALHLSCSSAMRDYQTKTARL